MKNIESYENRFALVVDNRDTHLELVRKTIEIQGYHVETAMSFKEAKLRVIERETTGGYSLIVADYDLGRELWLKHRMFDGFFFLFWCIRRGINAEMILHSTAFEPNQRFRLFMHRKVFRVITLAETLGIHVQPTSELLNS